jgi:hypothetical protein
MCGNHTMDYYSAMKRNEVLIHVTTGMSLTNIMLSKADTKCTYCIIPFTLNVQKGIFMETQ